MSTAIASTVLEPVSLPDFVETEYVKDVTNRALGYVKAGFPVHLRGISGVGKTTLAIHIAARIGRPLILIHGDEEFTTSDLIGSDQGYHMRKVRDNFIHSVLKIEESMTKQWVDNRLTMACKFGFTLLYDEYTRSRPEANNVLLSVLQEKILDIPTTSHSNSNYMKVHPDFTALFTSNPEEYAGVHRSQDALRDRMITIDLESLDKKTETGIVQAKSGLSYEDAKKIVNIVSGLRDSDVFEFAPTVRGCLMIAKSVQVFNARVHKDDKVFCQICFDILSSETSRIGSKSNKERVMQVLLKLIDQYCNDINKGGSYV
ncbi:MAG: gas vesicle protein GvpN [Proteobacteria bacterium]|nr:gas vesicle protein GvpN [Pseudomonadota bacterium]